MRVAYGAAAESTIPRDYNFAADILKRNLDAGRGNKLAYIDPAANTPMPSLPTGSNASARCCARSAAAARSVF